jgi:hypothetical protein
VFGLTAKFAIEDAHCVPNGAGRNGRYETGRLALYGYQTGIMRVKIEKSADPVLDAFENFSQI